MTINTWCYSGCLPLRADLDNNSLDGDAVPGELPTVPPFPFPTTSGVESALCDLDEGDQKGHPRLARPPRHVKVSELEFLTIARPLELAFGFWLFFVGSKVPWIH